MSKRNKITVSLLVLLTGLFIAGLFPVKYLLFKYTTAQLDNVDYEEIVKTVIEVKETEYGNIKYGISSNISYNNQYYYQKTNVEITFSDYTNEVQNMEFEIFKFKEERFVKLNKISTNSNLEHEVWYTLNEHNPDLIYLNLDSYDISFNALFNDTELSKEELKLPINPISFSYNLKNKQYLKDFLSRSYGVIDVSNSEANITLDISPLNAKFKSASFKYESKQIGANSNIKLMDSNTDFIGMYNSIKERVVKKP